MSSFKKAAAVLAAMGMMAAAAFTAFAEEPMLTSLSVVTAVQDGKNIPFYSHVTEYDYNVQSDCYGVKVKAHAPAGTMISINGEEVQSGESKIVPIDGSYANYDIVLTTPISVTATKGDMSKTYTVNVIRDCDTDIYNLFMAGEYYDEANMVNIPYELYVPTNYDPAKKYPIVFALHGSGQRTQSVDMLLKRYQMATIWAKDSEKGLNECIVLAPQCKVSDDKTENWTTLHAYRAGIAPNPYDTTKYLEGAYNLLMKVMNEYSVDRSRVYMTGLSAGGYATFTLAIEHPDVFAAIAPDASGADPTKVGALKGIPMWIFQAVDDPTVKVEEEYYPTIAALKAAGVDYKTTLYDAGTVFGTSAHFSWVPMYANKDFRNWLFAQRKLL